MIAKEGTLLVTCSGKVSLKSLLLEIIKKEPAS